MFSLLVKPELTGATTAPVRSLGQRLPFRLYSKRKSLVSVDQLSSGLTVKTNVVSPTCVPRLKPWPVILVAVNFVMILLL